MSKYIIKEPTPQYGANTARIVNVPDEVVKQIRADAIDDFVKKICEKYTEEESKGNYKQYCGEIKQAIADLAEELKADVKNE